MAVDLDREPLSHRHPRPGPAEHNFGAGARHAEDERDADGVSIRRSEAVLGGAR
ncbi:MULTISPECIES: hypothetical protein [unclassified Microbacterium]|uniref:hypothetical protein n=1 Tax=unclassified Microbacterium TaxID=2609290 RepID=UPI0015E2D5C8|nr:MULTISPECIES: hypothetical protein [unclassified Microbacterium]